MMSEIVNDPLLLSCYYLFPNFGSRNFNDLVLISSRLARARPQPLRQGSSETRAHSQLLTGLKNPEVAELVDDALDTPSASTTTPRSR
jgi:hypothetical protein